MAQTEVDNIRNFFEEMEIKPHYMEHEAVVTSEDAARTRGFELKQGIKAILFTNDTGGWVVVDIAADKKVDAKKVAEKLGWSKSRIRIATPEEVMQKTNCEIGAVPPFMHKELMPIFVDISVYDNQENAFNIGLKTHSVKLKTEFMKKVFEKIKAVEGSFAK